MTQKFKPDRRRKREEFVLTVGKPTFKEKEFLKRKKIHIMPDGTWGPYTVWKKK
jgi:hypothetical protein